MGNKTQVNLKGAATDGDLETSNPVESTAAEDALKAVAENTAKVNFTPEVAQRTVAAEEDAPAEVKPTTKKVKGSELEVGDVIIMGRMKGKVFDKPGKRVHGNVRMINDGRFFQLYATNVYELVDTSEEE